MTTYEKLLRAAATCQRDALLVLADCCEEEGRAEVAAGYRWMSGQNGHARWPTVKRHGQKWWWKWYAWKSQFHESMDQEDLPIDAVRQWKGSDGGWHSYGSLESALEAAAAAVGAWLARKEDAG